MCGLCQECNKNLLCSRVRGDTVECSCHFLDLYEVLFSLSAGPPRMSPKSQRTPRAHRVPPCRTAGVPPGVDLISHNAPGEVPVPPPTRSSSSGGTWSSVVSGGRGLCFIIFLFLHLLFCYSSNLPPPFLGSAHRPRSPRQNSMGGASPGSSSLPSPQTGTVPAETAGAPSSASSPTAASPAPNMAASPGDGMF